MKNIIELSKSMLDETNKRFWCEFLNFVLNKLSCMKDYPASTKYHHAYTGGLLDHTREMIDLYRREYYNLFENTIPIISILFHDYGKMYCYYRNLRDLHADKWYKSENVRKFGHIYLSCKFFEESYNEFLNDFYYNRPLYLEEFYLDNVVDSHDEIIHCILAHHGKLEWGSPVTPQTDEARIVHKIDMICSGNSHKL